MKILLLLLGTFLICTCCSTQVHRSKVMAGIDPHLINPQGKFRGGEGEYSILGDGRILITHRSTNELLIIRGGKIEKSIRVPTKFSTFDISKGGNGVVVGITFKKEAKGEYGKYVIFRVKDFEINTRPITLKEFEANEYRSASHLDMLNDTIVRLIANDTDLIIIAHIDSLETDRNKVCSDEIAKFICKPDFIGQYGDEYFHIDFYDSIRVVGFRIINNKLTQENEVNLGNIGHTILESCPIRYDPESGRFYIGLEQYGKLVIREFQLSDFSVPIK